MHCPLWAAVRVSFYNTHTIAPSIGSLKHFDCTSHRDRSSLLISVPLCNTFCFVLKMEPMSFSETRLVKYQTRRQVCSANCDPTTASPATTAVTSADRLAITTPPHVPACSSSCAMPRLKDDAST